MMRKIIESTYLDYIFLFGDVRTKRLDRGVQLSLGTGGKFLIMYEDDKCIGFLCYSLGPHFALIKNAYTRVEFRRKGVFTELLKYADQNEVLPMQMAVLEENDFGEIMLLPAILDVGFHKITTNKVYYCHRKDFHKWEEYMEAGGGKMVRLLERQGFEAVSFAEAPTELLEQLIQSENNSFENQLEVEQFFQKQERGLDLRLSHMAHKNGTLVAYCLVCGLQNGEVCFEQFSVAKEFRGTGVLILCFAKAMEQINPLECKGAWYEINEHNKESNAFRDKVLDKITSRRLTYGIYEYQEK